MFFFLSKPLQDGKEETAFVAHYLVIFWNGKSVGNIPNPCVLGAPGLADRLVQCGGSCQLLQDTRFSERDSTYFSSEFGLKLRSIDF